MDNFKTIIGVCFLVFAWQAREWGFEIAYICLNSIAYFFLIIGVTHKIYKFIFKNYKLLLIKK